MEAERSPSLNTFKCCTTCTRICYDTHGDQGQAEAEELLAAPSFMKPITQYNVSFHKLLRIPAMFMEENGYRIGESVTLRGPTGFEVEAPLIFDKGYALRRGFTTFITYYGVEIGDYLLFTLIAHSVFRIRVYNKHGVEKTLHSGLLNGVEKKNNTGEGRKNEEVSEKLDSQRRSRDGEGQEEACDDIMAICNEAMEDDALNIASTSKPRRRKGKEHPNVKNPSSHVEEEISEKLNLRRRSRDGEGEEDDCNDDIRATCNEAMEDGALHIALKRRRRKGKEHENKFSTSTQHPPILLNNNIDDVVLQAHEPCSASVSVPRVPCDHGMRDLTEKPSNGQKLHQENLDLSGPCGSVQGLLVRNQKSQTSLEALGYKKDVTLPMQHAIEKPVDLEEDGNPLLEHYQQETLEKDQQMLNTSSGGPESCVTPSLPSPLAGVIAENGFPPVLVELQNATTTSADHCDLAVQDLKIKTPSMDDQQPGKEHVTLTCDTEKEGAFEEAKRRQLAAVNARKSKNPTTALHIDKSSYTYTCKYFPKEFAKKWFPSKTRCVYLTNKLGKRWPLVWKPQDYKARFNGGWKSFAEDNDIKEGDVCWLELVNPIKLELQVHIFRIADYYNPKVVSDRDQPLTLCSPPENVCPKNIALDDVIIPSQPLTATTATTTTTTTNEDDVIVGVEDPEVEGDLENAANHKAAEEPQKNSSDLENAANHKAVTEPEKKSGDLENAANHKSERNPEKDSSGLGNVVAFDAAQAMALKLDRPHVIVMMRKSYIEKGYRLYLPNALGLLDNTINLTMVDASGKKYPVTWCTRNTGKRTNKGWGPFTLDHNLVVGDVCLFELTEPGKPEIRVHIFRRADSTNSGSSSCQVLNEGSQGMNLEAEASRGPQTGTTAVVPTDPDFELDTNRTSFFTGASKEHDDRVVAEPLQRENHREEENQGDVAAGILSTSINSTTQVESLGTLLAENSKQTLWVRTETVPKIEPTAEDLLPANTIPSIPKTLNPKPHSFPPNLEPEHFMPILTALQQDLPPSHVEGAQGIDTVSAMPSSFTCPPFGSNGDGLVTPKFEDIGFEIPEAFRCSPRFWMSAMETSFPDPSRNRPSSPSFVTLPPKIELVVPKIEQQTTSSWQ